MWFNVSVVYRGCEPPNCATVLFCNWLVLNIVHFSSDLHMPRFWCQFMLCEEVPCNQVMKCVIHWVLHSWFNNKSWTRKGCAPKQQPAFYLKCFSQWVFQQNVVGLQHTQPQQNSPSFHVLCLQNSLPSSTAAWSSTMLQHTCAGWAPAAYAVQ